MEPDKWILLGSCLALAVVFTFKHDWINRFHAFMHSGIRITRLAPRDLGQFTASKGILRSAGHVFWLVFALLVAVTIMGEPL